MRRNYPRDPYWTTAKFAAPGNPESKGGPIKYGDRIFYYPNTKTALKGEAAERASRDFDAAAFDERGF